MDKKDLAKIALLAMTSGLCVTSQLGAKELLGMSQPSSGAYHTDGDTDSRGSCGGPNGCGDSDAKGGNGKCGSGKCGNSKCGNGKCGSGKCGNSKCGSGKCGDSKGNDKKENNDDGGCPSCGKQGRMRSYSANEEAQENTIAKNMEAKRQNLLNG